MKSTVWLCHSFRRVPAAIDPYLVLLFALSGFALIPLLGDGYFYSAHDGRHSVFYVTMFDEAIRDGALWPRWAMHHNQGYGYPTFVVQAPLAFYAAEIFVLLGAGITNAVEIAWAVGFLAGAWGMYALVREWLMAGSRTPVHRSQFAAVVAGLLYIYIPYHLLNIYVRAAFAETMLMAWFPWVFLAFERLIARGTGAGWARRLFTASLSYAGILLTHVLALPAFTPLLLAFVIGRLAMAIGERQHAIRNKGQTGDHARRSLAAPDDVRLVALPAVAGIAALLLAALFLVPLLVEGPLLDQEVFIGDTYDYTRHFIYWGQMFNPFWGYGYSDDPTGANDGMGFQVGLLPLLLAFTAIYHLLAGRRRRTRHWWLVAFLLAASVAVLFSMTPAATSIWARIPLLAVVQFPWRLLALSSFTLSALGGLGLWRLMRHLDAAEEQGAEAGMIVVMLGIVLASSPYVQPQALQAVEPWREDGRAVFQFEREHPDMLGYTQWVQEPFTESPLTAQYLDPAFGNDRLERLGIVDGEGRVLSHHSRGHSFGGEVAMITSGVVQIRTYYFPGWRVTVDGAPVEITISEPHGLINVPVPPGRHRIAAHMGFTPARTAGAILSVGTLILLSGLWVWEKMRRRKNDTSVDQA